MDLTKRQQEIFDFIRKHSAKHGYPPTVRDIGKAVGLASSSTVHAHLANLEKIGLLRRDPTKPRAIELLDRAAGAAVESVRGIVRPDSLPLVGSVVWEAWAASCPCCPASCRASAASSRPRRAVVRSKPRPIHRQPHHNKPLRIHLPAQRRKHRASAVAAAVTARASRSRSARSDSRFASPRRVRGRSSAASGSTCC